MRVIIACEESQEVCKAFRDQGHEAYSCDTQECSGGHPEWHYKMDIFECLENHGPFDMMIAHPPCTFISNAGAARLYPRKGIIDQVRYKKGLKAKEFFLQLLNCDIPMIALENPIPSTVYGLPKRTQVIQPFEYGHPYSKKTYLWLKGLPNLQPTNIITEGIISWVSGGSKDHKGNPRKQSGTKHRDSKTRSKTFTGIAQAMAQQWGKL